MRAFFVIWFGQLISMLGSGMTRFALTIWAWQETQSATALALVAFFSFAPMVILSPLAGALVDRWPRRLVMMASDLAAGLATVAVLILYSTGNLEIWHLYVASAFASSFESFQFPAYSAAITTMVDKTQYARTSGMISMAEAGSGILAPALAGLLLVLIGINGVMLIDIVTFVFAVGSLLVVHIPQPEPTATEENKPSSLWSDSLFGFRYIFQRPSLLGLQLVFLGVNLSSPLAFTLLPAFVLLRTNQDSVSLGIVQASISAGGLAGGLLMSTWGGPKRKIHGVLLGMIGSGLLGIAVIGLGRSIPFWVLGAFLTFVWIQMTNASNQAIWQAKVPPPLQGRVFAIRRMIANISGPVAVLLAGPLADRIFEPAMMPGGALAGLFGGLVGVGPGAGMALILVLMGVFSGVVGLSGYLTPAVRRVEELIPDHTPDRVEERVEEQALG
ncbi:MAG: MFS transporter [Caldilineaceae bacterium]|nr:MFS transporter [Caldilineaceae bacterium]